MMTLQMPGALDGIVLTTDHPDSSYGLPVLVIYGEAYGPNDAVGKVGMLARKWVAAWCAGAPSEEPLTAHPLVQAFLAVPELEHRTEVRRLRLTPTEATTLEGRAAEAGKTLSQYVRDALAL